MENVLYVEPKDISNGQIQAKKPVFLLVYADWCGHCKNLKPAYSKIASTEQNKNSLICAVMGDSDDGKEVVQKLNLKVKGFPSMFKIKGKDIQEYNGGRDENSLRNAVKN